MPSVFSLYGELSVDTRQFVNSIKTSEARLKEASDALTKVEGKSKSLGDTSATVARRYEKLNEAIQTQKNRLQDNALAFERDEISAKKFSSVMESVARQTASVSSRIKDANARISEISTTGFSHFQNQIAGVAGKFSGGQSSPLSAITQAFSSMTQKAEEAGEGVEKAGAGLSAFAGPAAIAVGAAGTFVGILGGIAHAGVEAGEKLFDLADKASQFGKSLGGFQTITGLSSESVGTLANQLNFAGKTLDDVQRPLIHFNKLLYDAREGSDKAQASLAKVGVLQFSNIDAAFSSVAKNIFDTSNEVERLGKTTEIFGTRGGADMLKLIQRMSGSFEDAKSAAENLGVVLSQDDINAAKQFSHEWEKVMYQAKISVDKFALAYADDMSDAVENVSGILSKHQKDFEEFGRSVSRVFQASTLAVSDLISFVEEHKTALRVIEAIRSFGTSEIALGLGSKIGEYYKGRLDNGKDGFAKGRLRGVVEFPESTINDDDLDDKKSRQKALNAATSNLAKRMQDYSDLLDKAKTQFGKVLDARLDASNLKSLAGQFDAGHLNAAQSPGSKLADQLAAIGIYYGYHQKAIPKALAGMSASELLQHGFQDVTQDLSGKVVAASKLGLALPAGLNSGQQEELDKRIISLTRGLDPASLTTDQRQIASEAFRREANREESSTVKALKDLTDAIKTGTIIHIVNDDPDHAKVTTRPTAATTRAYYER